MLTNITRTKGIHSIWTDIKQSTRWTFNWPYMLKGSICPCVLTDEQKFGSTICLCKGRWVARTYVSSDCQDRLTHSHHASSNCGCGFFYIYSASPSWDIKILLQTSVCTRRSNPSSSWKQMFQYYQSSLTFDLFFSYHLSLSQLNTRETMWSFYLTFLCVCSGRNGPNLRPF